MMAFDASQLLKRLEPAVRPSGGRDAHVPARFEDRGFGELLALVSAGGVSTGQPLRCDCELDPALDEAQESRLAAAADRAIAAGAERALMLIDGRALVVDVRDRAIASELQSSDHIVDTSVDAAVYVASGAKDEPLTGLMLSRLAPGSVAAQIEAAKEHSSLRARQA